MDGEELSSRSLRRTAAGAGFSANLDKDMENKRRLLASLGMVKSCRQEKWRPVQLAERTFRAPAMGYLPDVPVAAL